MPKLNFTKYPEINAIVREISSLQARLVKVRKVMHEIEGRRANFYVILQTSQQKIKQDFAKQISLVKRKYAEDLKRARYFVTDLKRLEANYKNKVIELNDACRYQIEQRKARQNVDLDKLNESYQICKSEELTVLNTIDELNKQLHESWEFEKPKIKERRKIYSERIKEASKRLRKSSIQMRRESFVARQQLIKEFKKAHPYYNFLRFRIWWSRWQNVTKLDKNMYALVVKLNELKLSESKTPRADKKNLFNLKNERRLNEGKSESVTLTDVRNRFIKVTSRIINSKYISVLKGAFFSIIPIIFISSFFTLLNGFFFSTGEYGFFSIFHFNDTQKNVIEHFRHFGMFITNGINEMFAIIIVAAIAWQMAKYYSHVDGFVMVFITIICTVAMEGKIVALTNGEELKTLAALGGNAMDTNQWTEIFGKSESLVALVVGLTCPVLFAKLALIPRLRIHLPDDAPTIIVRTFNNLLPMILTVLVFAAASTSIYELGSISDIKINYIKDGANEVGYIRVYDLQDVATLAAAKVIGFSSNTLPNIILLMVVQQVLWIFGIDPDQIIRAITDPIFMKDISDLTSNVFTYETLRSFVEIGGGASFLAIILGILCFSKRRDYRIVAWIAVVPIMFNITEPLAYGLPLTFNPLFIFPMLLVAILLPVYVYLCVHAQPALQAAKNLMNSDLVSDSGRYLSISSLPFFIMAGISANTGWAAVLFSLTCLVLATGIYAPFIFISNAAEKQESMEVMMREKQREKMIYNQKVIQ